LRQPQVGMSLVARQRHPRASRPSGRAAFRCGLPSLACAMRCRPCSLRSAPALTCRGGVHQDFARLHALEEARVARWKRQNKKTVTVPLAFRLAPDPSKVQILKSTVYSDFYVVDVLGH
jgi:hypothetical protein